MPRKKEINMDLEITTLRVLVGLLIPRVAIGEVDNTAQLPPVYDTAKNILKSFGYPPHQVEAMVNRYSTPSYESAREGNENEPADQS